MELTVPDMEDLGEPNKRVGDPAEHVDSSPASFKSLALNFPLQPSLSPKSLGEQRAISSSASLDNGDFGSSSLFSSLNFGYIMSLINGIVKLPG